MIRAAAYARLLLSQLMSSSAPQLWSFLLQLPAMLQNALSYCTHGKKKSKACFHCGRAE